MNSPLGEVVGKTSSTANRWQFPALVQTELRYRRWFDKHDGGNSMMDEFTGGVAIRFSR